MLFHVSKDRRGPRFFLILSDYCLSSGIAFLGTGDWCRLARSVGSQDQCDRAFSLSTPGAWKLKMKHIYCPGVGKIQLAVSSWIFLVQNAHLTHEKLS